MNTYTRRACAMLLTCMLLPMCGCGSNTGASAPSAVEPTASAPTSVTPAESSSPSPTKDMRVPDDVVGMTEMEAMAWFDDLDVPVDVRAVAVTDTDEYPEGTVALSVPAAGEDIDAAEGVMLAIAEQHDVLGIDWFGKNADDAKRELEREGYQVTLMPRYSSMQYLGTVVGGEPTLGVTSMTANQSVVLYVGADADAGDGLLSDGPFLNAQFDGASLEGTYCREDGDGKRSADCLAFAAGDGAVMMYEEGVGGKALSLYTESHQPVPRDYRSSEQLANAELGVFELTEDNGEPYCGSSPDAEKTYGVDMAAYAEMGNHVRFCHEGTLAYKDEVATDPDARRSLQSSGTFFMMKELLVYYPVGANLPGLASRGYYDDTAMAEAQANPDTTRPFILRRGAAQYDETIVSADGKANNPFVPITAGRDGRDYARVAMKPAPSDTTVYYLQEDLADIVDWTQLEEQA